jgi:hypothetical protein
MDQPLNLGSMGMLMPFVRDPKVPDAGHPLIAAIRRQIAGGAPPQIGMHGLPGNEQRQPLGTAAPPQMGAGGGGMPGFGGGPSQLDAIAQALQGQQTAPKPQFGPRPL